MESQDSVLVSIVIPTYNRRDVLRRCLQGIFAQWHGIDIPYAPAFEITVIDNGSEDGTIDMLRREFPSVHVLINSTNRGASQARNQALRIISTKYVWFLDSDSVVGNPNCLTGMVKMMEENQDIGSIGGELIKDAQGRVTLKRKRIFLNGETGVESLEPRKVKLTDCDYLATCNCFTRRKLLLEIGGFDPDYFFLGEDTELGFQIKKLGYRNVCDYRTAVLHNIIFSQRRSIFLKCRNSIRFALKNLPVWQILIMPLSTIFVRMGDNVHQQLKMGESAVLKYIPGRLPFIFKLFVLGVMYILALFWAYMWNFCHLNSTLKARFKRENYIEDAPETLRYEN